MSKYLLAVIFIALFLNFAPEALAANRYWVGGGATSNWNATGPTNWGTASGLQDNASVPTSTDDVFFDGVGTGASNATISASTNIKSLDMTGYSNTLTHNAAVSLNVYGTSYRLGGTYTLGNAGTSATLFAATSSAVQITTNGKTLGNTTFNGSGSTFTLQDNLISSGFVVANTGTFNSNNFNVTCTVLSSFTNAITNMGSSTFTLTGTGTVWSGLNAVINATSSTFVISNTSATSKIFNGSNKTYGSITISGDNVSINNGNVFLGTFAVNNAGLPNGLKLANSATTSIANFTTNGSAGNLAKIISQSGLLTAGITASSSVLVSADFLSLTRISVSGGQGWYAGDNSVNGGSNIGWTFSSPTWYWVGGTGTWDSTAGSKWATTSGGTSGMPVPTSASNVFIDSNSGSGTVTLSSSSVARSINATGFTGTISHPAGVTLNIGDSTAATSSNALIFPSSGMTYNFADPSTSIINFVSTATTSQNINLGNLSGGNIRLAGGQIFNTLSAGANTFHVLGNISVTGTFTAGSSTFSFEPPSGTTTIPSLIYNNLTTAGSGTSDASSGATVDGDLNISSGATFSAPASALLTIAGNFTNSGTFNHNNGTVVFASSSKVSTISGATTFYNLQSTSSGKTIKFQSESGGAPVFSIEGTTTLTGASGNNIIVQSDSSGSQWLVKFSSPQAAIDYITLSDSGCATGSESVTSYANNTDSGNNGSCWGFPVPVVQSSSPEITTIHHSSSGSSSRRSSVPYALGVIAPPNPLSQLLVNSPANFAASSFTKDLQSGKSDMQVKLLQQYLNSHGYLVSQSGPGSRGEETSYFGSKTRAALINFQKEHGISPAAGYFGPRTRSFILSN